jgi:anion-transporting  ArsA/GET3 family ATPase
VLGKGGVGKSTVSAALGMAYARQGHRVLLSEVAGRDRLSRLLDGADATTEPTAAGDNLFVATIDPEEATEEYLRSQLPVKALADVLVGSKTFRTFSQAAPGLTEMVTIGKIWSYAVQLRREENAPEWDRLVVDCPATGHGIALLETARNVREIAQEGPIHDQAERIREVISHPAATGIAVVARPDELPVSEALEAIKRLETAGLPVAAAILNAMTPVRFSDGDTSALEAAQQESSGSARHAIETALAEAVRAAREAQHAGELEAGPLPVVRLPLITRGATSPAGLERLAQSIGEALASQVPA